MEPEIRHSVLPDSGLLSTINKESEKKGETP